MAVGIFIVWDVRSPGEEEANFHFGWDYGLLHLAVAALLWQTQNFCRDYVCETTPWSNNDYIVKIIFSMLIGFGVTACNLVHSLDMK